MRGVQGKEIEHQLQQRDVPNLQQRRRAQHRIPSSLINREGCADVRLRLLAKWFPQEYSEKLIGIETKGDINVQVITGVPQK